MVKFIHYSISNAGVEVVALAKETLVASLDRLRVFGSTICVDMTMPAFVDCGDHFENCWCDKISAGKKQKQLEFRTQGLEVLSHPAPRCQLCRYS